MNRFALTTTTITIVGVLCLSHPLAALADEPKEGGLHIEAQPLSTALREFSEQTGLQVGYASELAEGKSTDGVEGIDDPDLALESLLASSGLQHTFVNDQTVVVRAVAAEIPEDEGGDSDSGNGRPTPRPVLMTQNQPGEPQSRSTNEGTEENTNERGEKLLEEIVVTGTLIRGIAPESSPLQIYTREDILASGVTTTEQFIRTLPQNFGGSSTEYVPQGLPNAAGDGGNATYGSGANLRGLGSAGTLVLLNGRRLAPTSTVGGFVDVSLIPISALERVDVLTDGASSIYGGDAVAGVVNFVLRDDFEGAETTARYGTVTDGDMNELRVSQTVGSAWENGNILATYEFFDRDDLTLDDRPHIAAPTTLSGAEVARNRFDLLPEQGRRSAMIAFNQRLSSSLSVSASGLYSKRDARRSGVNIAGSGVLVEDETTVESTSFNFGAEYDIASDWTVSLDGSLSQLRSDDSFETTEDEANTTEYDSDVWSADLLINGKLIEMPGGNIKLALGAHTRREEFLADSEADGLLRKAERHVWAVYGEILLPLVGHQNALPGIERLELNISGRIDDYSDFGSASKPKIGLLWSPLKGLKLRSSYSESFAPPALGRVGDLRTTGLVFPTSFVADVLGSGGQYPTLEGTDYMILFGVADDLGPETSRAFTAGVDYDAKWKEQSFSASLNYYDIEFENRLGQVPMPNNLPSLFAPFIAFDDPSALPLGAVEFFPTQQRVDSLVSGFTIPVELNLGATLDNIGIINNIEITQNLAATKTQGLDFQIDHVFDSQIGEIASGLNANYIIDFTNQAATTTPAIDVLNSLYNPIDLKLRGNLGISRGNFTGNIFVNYTDSYKIDNSDGATTIDSWVTTDVSLAYEFKQRQRSSLDDLSINLSISNLFDVSPPETSTLGRLQLTGYDPANASPVGRFVALEMRKVF